MNAYNWKEREWVESSRCTLAGEKEGSAVWVACDGMKPPPEKAALPSNWLPPNISLWNPRKRYETGPLDPGEMIYDHLMELLFVLAQERIPAN